MDFVLLAFLLSPIDKLLVLRLEKDQAGPPSWRDRPVPCDLGSTERLHQLRHVRAQDQGGHPESLLSKGKELTTE